MKTGLKRVIIAAVGNVFPFANLLVNADDEVDETLPRRPRGARRQLYHGIGRGPGSGPPRIRRFKRGAGRGRIIGPNLNPILNDVLKGSLTDAADYATNEQNKDTTANVKHLGKVLNELGAKLFPVIGQMSSNMIEVQSRMQAANNDADMDKDRQRSADVLQINMEEKMDELRDATKAQQIAVVTGLMNGVAKVKGKPNAFIAKLKNLMSHGARAVNHRSTGKDGASVKVVVRNTGLTNGWYSGKDLDGNDFSIGSKEQSVQDAYAKKHGKQHCLKKCEAGSSGSALVQLGIFKKSLLGSKYLFNYAGFEAIWASKDRGGLSTYIKQLPKSEAQAELEAGVFLINLVPATGGDAKLVRRISNWLQLCFEQKFIYYISTQESAHACRYDCKINSKDTTTTNKVGGDLAEGNDASPYAAVGEGGVGATVYGEGPDGGVPADISDGNRNRDEFEKKSFKPWWK